MTYKVNLIPPNLRRNETIIQIADSLDHLSKIVDDIMLNIEKRVNLYSNKLTNVSNRVDIVESKISRLKSVKNAIQVFSSSKYPVNDTDRTYISIFPTNSDIPFIRHEVSQKYPFKKDEHIDKLHIYHVKLSKLEPEKIEGLGKVPNDTCCISDLILYNTGRNPYREFSKSYSLKLPHSSVRTENNKVQIGTAPASIAERSSFSNLHNQEYFYSPDLGDVPALDVPVDLPDLPGIAGNVRYEEDNNFGIAPSVTFSPTMTDNLVIQETLSDDLDGLPEIISSSPQNIEQLTVASKIVENKEQAVTQFKIIADQDKSSDITSTVEEVKKPEKIVSKLQAIPDARASLMEAIREAGGAKILKSAENKSSSPKDGVSSGDLMADLHAKLAMRRKGISGTKKNIENAELDSRGALSLMSALIPPPEETNEETDQEEDWE